jgi:acyl-CoA hydrolase
LARPLSGVADKGRIMSALGPKSPASSVTEMTEYVLPQHATVFGTVFGGQIMAWVDICAAICAQRHAGRP